MQITKFYDNIVDIDSLRNINKRRKIKLSKVGKNNNDIMKDKKVLIVVLVENGNRGKTFVLSKLSNANLPDGTKIKTEGINIKCAKLKEGKDPKYIIMDSVVLENALLKKDILF